MIRLLPQREHNTPIKRELFDYSLSETSGEKHIYEALSYVWGNVLKSQSITLNGCAFSVTENLNAALWNLRDRQPEQVLWVDAICINQEDKNEKEKQIPLMRTIYAQAGRVIVWLGPSLDHGDEALQNIRLLARTGTRGERPTPRCLAMEYDRCVMGLRRDWFRRMWVRCFPMQSKVRCTTLSCGNGLDTPGSGRCTLCDRHVWVNPDRRARVL